MSAFPIQENEESQQRFKALLEHASLGIIETNHLARIVHINPFAARLFGYAEKELLGEPIEKLIPQRFRGKHEQHRDQYIEHPRNRPMGVGMDLFAVRKDGSEFPVEVSLSTYQHEGIQHVIAFVSDITIRKKAEKSIKELNDSLEATVEQRTLELRQAIAALEDSREELSRSLEKEKELNELKTRFVSMASHEFRTPLSTVLSSSYLLQQYTRGEDQPKRDKHLQRIISSVNLLTDILNDFLSVGKIEEGKIQLRRSDLELPSFVSGTIEELRSNLKPGQSIRYHHEGPAYAWIDGSLLKHILLNLLSNASKFSPEDSVIEVQTTIEPQQLLLTVRDKGIGISPEDQKHLKERFFRAANAATIQGTGLGLHIVSKYVELLEGSLDWESELGAGTTFYIRLPGVKRED